MGPYQRTPKKVARVIRYTGLGVRSVGPVGDFLDKRKLIFQRSMFRFYVQFRGSIFGFEHGDFPGSYVSLPYCKSISIMVC